MNLISKIKKTPNILYSAGVLIIIVIYEIGIDYYIVPSVIFDEIGYWSSAAYFAGYDWSGILSYTSYYGYGMGLILSLFMKLIKDPIILYQVVLQLQVLMIVIIYLIALKVLKILYDTDSYLSIMLVGVITACYPALQMNAKLAWSECFVTFFTWLSLYFFVKFVEKKKNIYIICLGIILGYLYMIHMRNIGSICFILLLMTGMICLRKKSLDLIKYVVFIATIVSMLLIAYFIKNNIQENVFYTCGNLDEDSNVVAVNVNDYSGRISNVINSIFRNGIRGICFSLIGKIYYTIIATIGLSCYFFVCIYKKVKNGIKNKDMDNSVVIIIYIFLFFAGAFVIDVLSALAIEDGARADGLIYGRYMEHTFPMIVMVGLYYFSTVQVKLKDVIKVNIVILTIGVAVFSIYLSFEFSGWVNICVPMVDWGYEKLAEFQWVLFYCMCVVGTSLGCWTIKARMKNRVLVLALIAAVFLGVSRHTVGIVYNLQSSLKLNVELAGKINEMNYKVPIYCLRQDLPYLYLHACEVQFLLPDYKVSYISREQADRLYGEYYLLVESTNDFDLSEVINIYRTNTGWYVLIPKEGELSSIIKEKGF